MTILDPGLTMELHLHNTATRRKEVFRPIDPQHGRLYVCGPTVYNLAHLGRARPVIVLDVLTRLLRHPYPRGTYVRNITDVDAKIVDRARESGEPIGSITARTTEDPQRDMAALNALPPDVEPRATSHIGEMVQVIGRLIESGHDTARAEQATAARIAARKARDDTAADRIRTERLAERIVLEDGPDGTTWRRIS